VQLITRLDRVLSKIEEVVLALLLVGMVLLAAMQVVLRNVWNTSIDWADNVLQNATLLLGLLGAAIATSEGRHLTIDIFSRLITGRAKLALRVVIGTFALFVCVLLAQGGVQTYRVNYAQWLENIPKGWTVLRSIEQELLEGSIPQWLSQVMLPVGYSLIGLHFLLRLLRDVSSLSTGKEWETKESAGPEGEAALDALEAHAAAQADKGARP
jgi:TRAP-type C4-dicarboxylate transport system permease small subunit